MTTFARREARPYEPGNTESLVYGHTSPRAIAQRAVQVHAELLKHAPYLAEPRFLPAVSRYLEAAARESLLHEHIMTVSAEKGPGAVPSRTWEQATAAARLAAQFGSALGLDPIGHARIRALSVGAEHAEASLQELMEQGRRRRKRVAGLPEMAAAEAAESGGDIAG